MGVVQLTSSAKRDQSQIVDYIASNNLAAAIHWLEQIEILFNLLSDQPNIGERVSTRRRGQTRRRAYGEYVIYYRPMANGVQIFRILHGARMPDRLI